MPSPLLLWLHLCLLWPLCCGQTCSSTGQSGSSCHRSRPCRADHPSEDIECVPNPHAPFPYPSSLPPRITRCPRSNGMDQRCQPVVDVNETVLYENRITSAAVDLNSIDYVRFAMNVSWNHSHNPTGGYEVRVRDEFFLIDCYCVNDPNLQSLYLDDGIAYPPFTYRASSSGTITVEVSLLSTAPSEGSLSASVTTGWPGSCLDITHTSATCGLPVYDSPSNVVVYKHFSRSNSLEDTFEIRWQYNTTFVAPTLYYVEIFNVQDINEFYTFVVNNTRSIEVSHLPSTSQYYVHVQSYVHCSGLANRTYSLGCGLWSRLTRPVNILPPHRASASKNPKSSARNPTAAS